MRFGNLDHLGKTVRKKPIVSVEHLTVPTVARDLVQGMIPIRHQG
jgi:hypothetical protein